MENESILHVDDQAVTRDSIRDIIETRGAEAGHQLVGSVSSLSEVRELLTKGLRPSLALVDKNCPNPKDGERIARLIREISPSTVIIALSTEEGLPGWADYILVKIASPRQIINFLTNLRH